MEYTAKGYPTFLRSQPGALCYAPDGGKRQYEGPMGRAFSASEDGQAVLTLPRRSAAPKKLFHARLYRPH